MAGELWQQFVNNAANEKQRRQSIADDYRKSHLDQLTNATHNVQKMIALLTDPETMQPLKGKEQAVTGLRSQLAQMGEYQKALSNPNFDPTKDKIGEDPLHKLSDKLHLTKAPVQPTVAPGKEAVSQFQDSSEIDAATKRHETEQSIESARALLKKYGASDKLIEDVTAGMLGAKSAVSKPVLKPYKLPDGSPAWLDASDPASIPEGAQPILGANRAPKEKIVPDADSPTGFSAIGYDESGQETYRVKNVVPPRTAMPTETTTTDTLGQTTTSVRKPIFPGGKSGEGKTSQPKQTKPPGVQKKELQSKIGQTKGPKQLDAQGHIPETDHSNPALREAANNLLDGMAVKDLPIPAKDKAAVEALAKQYGWAGQGMFTPRDKLLVRESTAILNQLSSSPALSVLDDAGSRQKLMQVLQNPEKRGALGQGIQAYVASSLTPQEQEFVTLYNQAVGRISGLSQLVRSGRATEAQIERLKSELPNPATTANSEHARQKLRQIQSEIDIALQKGQFTDDSGVGSMSDEEFLQQVH